MSPLELDDSLNGSVVGSTASDTIKYIEDIPKSSLRDRMIEFVIKKGKATKSDMYLNISGSGSAQVLVSNLIQNGIFEEHYFNCHNCKYYTINQSKVNEA